MKKRVTIHSLFGSWVVTTNDIPFPKLFKEKEEALEVAKQIAKNYDVQKIETK